MLRKRLGFKTLNFAEAAGTGWDSRKTTAPVIYKLTIGTRAVLLYHILSNLKDEASHGQIQETVSNWSRGFIRTPSTPVPSQPFLF